MSKIKIFALGGLNENGKNMYVVEVNNDIFVFDAGLKYADDKILGVDYIIPNYEYLINNSDRIKGIFITHGHDEQMGALSDILVDLPNVSVYGTSFTLEIIKQDLLEVNLPLTNLVEIKPHKKITFGENSIFPISLTHAVPDTVGYVLYTNDGAIFYTGNFVFDSTMLDAYRTDIGKLAYVGKQGVLCLLSESLYANRVGFTSPKHRTLSSLKEVLNHNDKRILYNIFQTQLYRIQELFNAVLPTHRDVVIVGKKMSNIISKSMEMGYLKFDKSRILNIHHINDSNVVVLISDEMGQPFSNLKRIIKGYDKFIHLKESDTLIFASPIYEGLEKSASNIFDGIAKTGCNLVIMSTKQFPSLHASSEDLMLMLDLMQPKYYFPVNGEYRHQVANAEVASKLGIKKENIFLKLNGDVITFNNGVVTDSSEKVLVDDILIDGKTVGDIGELVLKDREVLSENGIVIVTVTLDKHSKSILSGPEVLTRGFIYVKDNTDLINSAIDISSKIIIENTRSNYIDFNKIKNGIRDQLGKFFYAETECKPMILIQMQEI